MLIFKTILIIPYIPLSYSEEMIGLRGSFGGVNAQSINRYCGQEVNYNWDTSLTSYPCEEKVQECIISKMNTLG